LEILSAEYSDYIVHFENGSSHRQQCPHGHFRPDNFSLKLGREVQNQEHLIQTLIHPSELKLQQMIEADFTPTHTHSHSHSLEPLLNKNLDSRDDPDEP
jgi:hypothetical protein